ncbi:AraC family transcriptional regulator [Sphingomonas sp. CD22]|uniref:AraC family transcriptional regulator n=1 Tax=Sphingomonas sp. CD22 TaxID=3100214 RepID=UPI002ADF9C6B|nr:AraC family transcriptional regulator [Sphingomonas sp. CD22]MEA1086436.1 AraC family transcriptional regulator [Sphingomonas sp. CD22]
MDEMLDRLCTIVDRHAAGRYQPSALPRVALYKDGAAPQPVAGVYQPMTALIVSGAKEIAIGDRRLRYDPASYFIATVELPASGCVKLDLPDQRYLAVSLDLDSERLASVLTDVETELPSAEPAFAVNPVTADLLDAWLRLLRLLDTPQDIAALAPLYEREILYRLVQGPQGSIVRQIARADSRLSQVRRAIAMIRDRFDQPIRSESLAEAAGMSPASFHRHFRTATAMSPLQYQKSLRLQEARRLIVAGRDVAAAGYAVGYESASQFSREYARLFGLAPSRDVKAQKPSIASEGTRAA